MQEEVKNLFSDSIFESWAVRKILNGNSLVIEKGISGLEFEIVKSHYKIHIPQWNKLKNEEYIGEHPKRSFTPTYMLYS